MAGTQRFTIKISFAAVESLNKHNWAERTRHGDHISHTIAIGRGTTGTGWCEHEWKIIQSAILCDVSPVCAHTLSSIYYRFSVVLVTTSRSTFFYDCAHFVIWFFGFRVHAGSVFFRVSRRRRFIMMDAFNIYSLGLTLILYSWTTKCCKYVSRRRRRRRRCRSQHPNDNIWFNVTTMTYEKW